MSANGANPTEGGVSAVMTAGRTGSDGVGSRVTGAFELGSTESSSCGESPGGTSGKTVPAEVPVGISAVSGTGSVESAGDTKIDCTAGSWARRWTRGGGASGMGGRRCPAVSRSDAKKWLAAHERSPPATQRREYRLRRIGQSIAKPILPRTLGARVPCILVLPLRISPAAQLSSGAWRGTGGEPVISAIPGATVATAPTGAPRIGSFRSQGMRRGAEAVLRP